MQDIATDNSAQLEKTIAHLTQDAKGILAADESTGTIGKRFDTIGVANTEKHRRDYRLLLANTPELSKYIHSVILYEETFNQHNDDNTRISDIFQAQGILPGIKLDQGLAPMPFSDDESLTKGLDTLEERLQTYKKLGAKFAKWRNVHAITQTAPTITAIKSGAEVLARYASICQANGIVPIVEPELLMDGNHDINHAAETQEMILHELFNALFMHQVSLEHIVLKPSMVTAGSKCKIQNTPEEIADYTISVFRNVVPAAVPTINFLSGGQTPEQATINLNAINSVGQQPWLLSFSYGRALQDECLKTWQGKHANIESAQKSLLQRAKFNSLACCGEYPS
jgi:fructose-bisphosphate aldolase class I